MLNRMTIKVTQEDINNGEKSSCTGCPIALALRRKFRAAKQVEVGTSMVNIWYDEKLKQIKLPKSITTFIERFDDGCGVQPFTKVVSYRTKVWK